jgi:hypothetical protein
VARDEAPERLAVADAREVPGDRADVQAVVDQEEDAADPNRRPPAKHWKSMRTLL